MASTFCKGPVAERTANPTPENCKLQLWAKRVRHAMALPENYKLQRR